MSDSLHKLRKYEIAVCDKPQAGDVAVWRRRHFIPADASRHRAIFELLHTTFPGYSYEDFAEWLEEPTYDPGDRHLLYFGSELVGHAQLVLRYAVFGGVRLPIALIREFAVRSEFDCEEVQAELLARVEHGAMQRGAVMALWCGQRISAVPDQGWRPLPRQGYSEADPQEVLSRLGESPAGTGSPARGTRVGLFRRTDLDGLMALYAAETDTKWGNIVRNETCWHWLLGRQTHDMILVATTGRKRMPKSVSRPALIGYAIAKRNHVLEMLPTGNASGERLLGRLCRDAVDQGDHTLTLHTPSDDPLHQVLFSAGGGWCDSASDCVRPILCKLLDREHWIDALFPEWRLRLHNQGLTPPCSLLVELPGGRRELVVSRRSAHWNANCATDVPADIACDENTFAALLTGLEDWQSARDAGRLMLAKPRAAVVLSALFSRRLWHFTLLDWL